MLMCVTIHSGPPQGSAADGTQAVRAADLSLHGVSVFAA
jgi:hypothetical protein